MKPIYYISKKDLIQQYKIKKLSIIECAKHFGCSESPIQRLLKKYNIPYNTKSEMMKGSNAPWFGKVGKHHPNWHRVKRLCGNCGKSIVRKKCHLKFKQSFCSMKCHGQWKSKHLIGRNNPSFTSMEVKCSWCGKKVLKNLYRIHKNKNNFCCRAHNGLWKAEYLRGPKIYNWKGGYLPFYGDNWRVQRRKALERDNYTCQRCGKTKDVLGKNPDVHHIKPFCDYGVSNYRKANHLRNLVSLCGKCHSKITNGLDP